MWAQKKMVTFQQRGMWRLSSRGVERLRLSLLLAPHSASQRWSSPYDWGLTQWICFGWCEWVHAWVRHCSLLQSFWLKCEDSRLQYRASVWAAPVTIAQQREEWVNMIEGQTRSLLLRFLLTGGPKVIRKYVKEVGGVKKRQQYTDSCRRLKQR